MAEERTVIVKVRNDQGEPIIRITTIFFDDELIVDRSKGRFTLILGPLELNVPCSTAERIVEMLSFVMENEKIWI